MPVITKAKVKQFALGALVAALGAGSYVIAEVAFDDFKSGDVISASQMNDKLNALKAAVNANTAACPARSNPGDARFTDNLDGTICDADTGLMWERKTGDATSPAHNCATTPCLDPHNVNNRYAWTEGGGFGTAPDGLLFTQFLAQLNGYVDVTIGGAGPSRTCFAGHCDWRIPTIEELQTIIDTGRTGCGGGTACIHLNFGPTQLDFYWSTSSNGDGFRLSAWGVNFNTGILSNDGKNIDDHARAVRGGR